MSADFHRKLAMSKIEGLATWKKCWPVWETEIRARTGNLADPEKVLKLGGQLREVFFATNTGSRDQGALSGGGTGWEALVTWYLNLVLSGTNAVAVRQSKATVPLTLLDATTITYGSHQTNTEADVSVIIYPRDFSFPAVPKEFLANLDKEVKRRFSEIELSIIQCKTNWNDNAQIPMLWDMVYKADFGNVANIHLGRGGFVATRLKRFTYAFVTVPSQKEGKMPSKSDQMAVKRVANLSGGNYWGMPTKSGVALSLGEIFTRPFANAFKKDVQASIKDAMDGRLGLFADLT